MYRATCLKIGHRIGNPRDRGTKGGKKERERKVYIKKRRNDPKRFLRWVLTAAIYHRRTVTYDGRSNAVFTAAALFFPLFLREPPAPPP